MSEDKSTLGNMADAAGAKLKEGADHARAAGHEVAASMTDGATHVEHKAEAAVDRAKAGAHGAQADAHAHEARHEATDGDGH